MDHETNFRIFSELVRSRRTNLNINRDDEVDHSVIYSLCQLVSWAPNHRRTWPWRVAVLEGDSRARLGELVAQVMKTDGKDPSQSEKARIKYLRSPSIIVVGSDKGIDEIQTLENREAVAAGIQNLLLGATCLGLATFWSSCYANAEDSIAEFCGFPTDAHISGIIYLGWPTRDVVAPDRSVVEVTYISEQ